MATHNPPGNPLIPASQYPQTASVFRMNAEDTAWDYLFGAGHRRMVYTTNSRDRGYQLLVDTEGKTLAFRTWDETEGWSDLIGLTGLQQVSSADSSTVDFSGSGTIGSPLTASVKKSATAGNTVSINADGLYVPAANLTGYATESWVNAGFQPLDSDLTSIAGLSGTSGLLRKTGSSYVLDTAAYITASALAGYIAKDGTTTTTASIPFAQGASFGGATTFNGVATFNLVTQQKSGFSIIPPSGTPDSIISAGSGYFEIWATNKTLYMHSDNNVQYEAAQYHKWDGGISGSTAKYQFGGGDLALANDLSLQWAVGSLIRSTAAGNIQVRPNAGTNGSFDSVAYTNTFDSTSHTILKWNGGFVPPTGTQTYLLAINSQGQIIQGTAGSGYMTLTGHQDLNTPWSVGDGISWAASGSGVYIDPTGQYGLQLKGNTKVEQSVSQALTLYKPTAALNSSVCLVYQLTDTNGAEANVAEACGYLTSVGPGTWNGGYKIETAIAGVYNTALDINATTATLSRALSAKRALFALATDDYTADSVSILGPNSTGLAIGTHLDGNGFGADIVARGYSTTYGDLRIKAANGSFSGFQDLAWFKADQSLTLYGALSGPSASFSGQILASSGSSGAPGFAFSDEPTLGFYRSAANIIRATGQIIAGASITTQGNLFASLSAYTSDGSAGSPAYSFSNEITLGFWRSGAGAITLQGALTTTGRAVLPTVTATATGEPLNLGSGTGTTSPSTLNAGAVWINATDGMCYVSAAAKRIVADLGSAQTFSAVKTFTATPVISSTTASTTAGAIYKRTNYGHVGYEAGMAQEFLGGVYTAPVGTALTNSTAETDVTGGTALFGTRTTSTTVWQNGTRIRLQTKAVVTNSAANTLTLRIKYGTTVVATITITSIVGTATPIDIWCEGVATGAPGAAVETIWTCGVEGSTAVVAATAVGTVTALATSTASAVSMTAQWGTALATSTYHTKASEILIL